jgi:hypothetical protein
MRRHCFGLDSLPPILKAKQTGKDKRARTNGLAERQPEEKAIGQASDPMGAISLPALGRHEEGSPPRRKDRTTPADRGVDGGRPLVVHNGKT